MGPDGLRKVRSEHRCGRRPEYRSSKRSLFSQLIPPWENWRMKRTKTPRIIAPGLVLAAMNLAMPANATSPARGGSGAVVVAQAMIPRTGMMDEQNPMPMKERYLKRFPQSARV